MTEGPDRAGTGATQGTWRGLLPGSIGLVVLTLVVFSPVGYCDFITFDDPQYVTHNPAVRAGLTWRGLQWAFTSELGGQWMPLTWLSHMLDCELFGARPGPHHLTSLAIHAGSVVLLYLTLAAMTGEPRPSWVVAAFFAIHPQRVESVAWIAERKDVLSMFFLLATLHAYHRFVKNPSPRLHALVLCLYLLGLMCKQMLVTLPLLLFVVDFWPLRRMSREGLWNRVLEKVPMMLVAAGAALLKLHVAGRAEAVATAGTIPWSDRLANVPVSLVAYLRQFFYPHDLSVFHVHRHGQLDMTWVVVSSVLLILIGLFCVRVRRDWPWIAAGGLWFGIALLPVIGIVQAGLQGRADRFMYVPSIGLLIALVWTLDRATANLEDAGRWRILLVAVGLTIHGFTSIAYVLQWRNSLTLYTHALDVDEDNDFAQSAVAAVLFHMGSLDLAAFHFERAYRLRPASEKYRRDYEAVREHLTRARR